MCLICLPYLNTISNSCKLNPMIIRAWNGWTPAGLTIGYCAGLNTLMSQHKERPPVHKYLIWHCTKGQGSFLAHISRTPSPLFFLNITFFTPQDGQTCSELYFVGLTVSKSPKCFACCCSVCLSSICLVCVLVCATALSE